MEDGRRSRGWPTPSARSTSYNPVTRIVGHGILDLVMIGKRRAALICPLPTTTEMRTRRPALSWYEAPGLRPGALPGPQGLRAGPRADEGRRPGARRDGVRRVAEA